MTTRVPIYVSKMQILPFLQKSISSISYAAYATCMNQDNTLFRPIERRGLVILALLENVIHRVTRSD